MRKTALLITIVSSLLVFGIIHRITDNIQTIDLPEEIQAAKVGDTLIVLYNSPDSISLGFKYQIMETNKDIYKMNLHEYITMHSGTLTIIRVPGGWIYKDVTVSGVIATFIPYHNEFQL